MLQDNEQIYLDLKKSFEKYISFKNLPNLEAKLKRYIEGGFPIDFVSKQTAEGLWGNTLLLYYLQKYDQIDWRSSFMAKQGKVMLLLNYGADVNKTNEEGNNALMFACLKSIYIPDTKREYIPETLFKRILSGTRDINAANKYGNTALDILLKTTNSELSYYICAGNDKIIPPKIGAKTERIIKSQFTDFFPRIRLLLEAGAEIRDKDGFDKRMVDRTINHNVGNVMWNQIQEYLYTKTIDAENEIVLEQYER